MLWKILNADWQKIFSSESTVSNKLIKIKSTFWAYCRNSTIFGPAVYPKLNFPLSKFIPGNYYNVLFEQDSVRFPIHCINKNDCAQFPFAKCK